MTVINYLQDHPIHVPRLHYCKPCQRQFVCESAIEAHLENSKRHSTTAKRPIQPSQATGKKFHIHLQDNGIKCSKCHRSFEDEINFLQHLQDDHSDIYCVECPRLFKTSNDLKIHMKSSTHVTKEVKCLDKNCTKKFLTIGCLIAHLQGGTCVSGMEIDELERIFSKLDKEGIFVKEELIKTVLKWEIIPLMKDTKKKYQCPLCKKEKIFIHPSQLQQHLKSPKHKNRGSKPFQCPSKKCLNSSFSSLVGLLFHQEMRNCDKGHNLNLKKLCHQLITGSYKYPELKLEIEVVRKQLERLLNRVNEEIC